MKIVRKLIYVQICPSTFQSSQSFTLDVLNMLLNLCDAKVLAPLTEGWSG